MRNFVHLVLSVACLSLLGCSMTEMSLQFKMEKAIDRANKMKRQYHLTGGGLNEREYEELTSAYEAITRMIPPPPDDSVAIRQASEPLLTSWQMAGLAYYNLGLLKIDGEDYDGAFDDFQKLITRYGFKSHQVQTALFMQAMARYRQKRFSEAVLLYNRVAQHYVEPGLSIHNPNMDALESPLTAARILRDSDEPGRFKDQLYGAIDYYWDLLKSYEGSPLGDAAIGKLASAFLLGDLADSAVATLSRVKDTQTGKNPPLVLINIANIQKTYLRNYPAAEESYRKFVESYPNHRLVARVQLGIGVALYYQKKYEKARYELSRIDKIPRVSIEIMAEAHYLTAICFELEGKWQRAMGEFDYVWANFSASSKGMESPIHIAEYYLNRGEVRLAAEAFDEAEKDYNRLISLYAAKPRIAARAMSYLVRCHISQNRREKAVETLRLLAGRYPETPEGFSALPQASDILAIKLGKPKEAAVLLRLFMRNYPVSPDADKISAYVDSLEAAAK